MDPTTTALIQQILGAGGSSGKSKSNPASSKYLIDFINKTLSQGKTSLGQQKAYGQKQIGNQLQNFLSTLGQPQAYSDVPLVQLSPEQQNLSQALLAHGASTQPAESTMQNQQSIAQQYADLAKRSAQQLNQAQQTYYGDVRQAAQTGAAEANQQLLLNYLALIGQLMAGANTQRANVVAQYGAPAR